jgi:ATP-binding cassette subfamily B protein
VIDWARITWPEPAVGTAMAAAARTAGLEPRHADVGAPPAAVTGAVTTISMFLESAAHLLGIESEPVGCRHEELPTTLASIGASLVRLRVGDAFRWLAVVASGPRRLEIIGPDRRRTHLDLDALHAQLTSAMDAEPGSRVDKWLGRAQVPQRRAARARRQLLAYLLAERRVEGMWVLREDPGSSFARQLQRRGMVGLCTRFLGASLAQVVVSVGGWVMIARGALQGVVEPGWLVGWALLCVSMIPLQVWAARTAGELGTLIATRLKQRLLCGALRMDPNEIRRRGSGGLLALVSESQAIDGAGFGGALRSVTGLVQLLSACAVLWAGAGGWLHVVLLLGYLALIGAAGRKSAIARGAWTEQRFELTNRFVEHIIGNRTRVAQERRDRHHARDDGAFEAYLHASRAMDRWSNLVAPFASRGWVAVALLGLAQATLARDASVSQMAVSVAGILQASTALASLVPSLQNLLGAGIAYRSVRSLFEAAAVREEPGVPEVVSAQAHAPATAGSSVLAMHGVSFQFDKGGKPVIDHCDLDVREGDRVLLEGGSGEGKSTLASLASGLRAPDKGLVLLRGMDEKTLGAITWRRRVASAPQFHDNHILSGTLAFNLLMGRAWPPSEADLGEAEALCRRLGLGTMLDRMPSKLGQVVGETGWQLSHGERSRVFLARALLQHAEVVVLDECFGALDPDTLATCMDVVREYARTLVVIAHP